MSTKIAPAPEITAAAPGPRATLWTLRVLAVLHALSAIAQPLLAGIYLDGDVDALAVHEINATVVSGLGVCQLVAAIVYVWAGRGRAWPLYASLGLVLAEQVQVGLGYERIVAIHIPLGVSIIAMQILLTVWLFRASARRSRRAS
ncbi:hypothetical protein [Actinophytocola sp.]|uniref:hypothetical protein n=1 Tax=Actinophytocola sp. TaxID=1872138 RepID=UPI002ED2877B